MTTEVPNLTTEELEVLVKEVESLRTQNAMLQERLSLAGFKLVCMEQLAEVIDVPVSPVWMGATTALTIRDFLGCNSIQEMKDLAEKKRSVRV